MSRKAGTLLALAAVVAVGGAGYVVAQHAGVGSAASDTTPTPEPSGVGQPGAASASPVDASHSSAASTTGTSVPTDSGPAQTPATNPVPVVTGTTVPVSVTFSGWNAGAHEVEVGGYVTGVIESDGTCTLTLTRGGATVSAQRSARPDAATTACGELDIPGSRLAAGTWTAVLSYRSAGHTGAAAPVQIEVTP